MSRRGLGKSAAVAMLRSGGGGLPPRRADQRTDPPPAVTPSGSSSGLFRGYLVIIFGTGKSRGLFVYSGNPAPGNPPVFSVVAPGVTADPYGNTVAAVMQAGVPGAGQTQIDQTGDILLSGADGSQVIRLNPVHRRIEVFADPAGADQLLASIAAVQSTNAYGNTVYQGLAAYSPGGPGEPACVMSGTDIEFLDISGNVLFDLQVTSGSVIVNGQTGATDWTFTQFQRVLLQGIPVDELVAIHPGSVATAETWQSMATRGYQHSWANSGSGPAGQYRYVPSPANCVELVGDLTGGTLTDATVFLNLPAAYRPATSQTCPFLVPGTGAAANMRFQVGTNGNITCQGISGLGASPRLIIPAGTLISLDA